MAKEDIKPLSDFGLEVRMRLFKLRKTQVWLIEEVKKRSGMYFDNGWLQSLLSGRRKSAPKEELIMEILSEEEARNNDAVCKAV